MVARHAHDAGLEGGLEGGQAGDDGALGEVGDDVRAEEEVEEGEGFAVDEERVEH